MAHPPEGDGGPTTKMPTNSTTATTIDSAICRDDRCTSSGDDSFAEMDRALTPMEMAWPRAMIPRKNGLRRIRNRWAMECDVVGLDVDRTIGPADGDRPHLAAAHHDALHDGLAAVGVAGSRPIVAHPRCGGQDCGAERCPYRRWNRSTRPPVSTSFCLPV